MSHKELYLQDQVRFWLWEGWVQGHQGAWEIFTEGMACFAPDRASTLSILQVKGTEPAKTWGQRMQFRPIRSPACWQEGVWRKIGKPGSWSLGLFSTNPRRLKFSFKVTGIHWKIKSIIRKLTNSCFLWFMLFNFYSVLTRCQGLEEHHNAHMISTPGIYSLNYMGKWGINPWEEWGGKEGGGTGILHHGTCPLHSIHRHDMESR